MSSDQRIKLDWKGPDEFGGYRAMVPAKDYRGCGEFEIYAEPRPHYCDRGEWKVIINSLVVSPLDDQEGFPRYYFKLQTLKDEMELWANKRAECRIAKQK